MKNIFARLICWLLKRHTIEYMKNHGASVHNFYGVNGPGRMCTCPKCGKSVIVYSKRHYVKSWKIRRGENERVGDR